MLTTCIAHITPISSTMAPFSSNVFGNYFTENLARLCQWVIKILKHGYHPHKTAVNCLIIPRE